MLFRECLQFNGIGCLCDRALRLKLHLLIKHILPIIHLSVDYEMQLEMFPIVPTSGAGCSKHLKGVLANRRS